MQLYQALAEHIEYCQQIKMLSEHTIRAYQQDAECLKKFLLQDIGLEQIDQSLLEAYLKYLNESGKAKTTIKRRFAYLKSFFKKLERDSAITTNPFAKAEINIRLPYRLPKNLTNTELNQLFKNAWRNVPNPHQQLVIKGQQLKELTILLSIEIMLITGLRIGELTSIKLEDIDHASKRIAINGKGQRERHVFITNEDTYRLLERYTYNRASLGVEHEILLITSRLTPATPQYIRMHIHKLREQVGLSRKVTPHMYRHSAATLLLEAGVDMRFVQKLLGHQSISTTEIYTHVNSTVLKQKIEAANIRGRLKNYA